MPSDSRDLERVRDQLQHLGYLSHGFERFLLQDALKPRRPMRTVLVLAVKVAALVGVILALVLTFALAAANGNLKTSPFDLLPLFLHLLPPLALVVGVSFVALCGALLVLMGLYHARRIEAWSLAAALFAGAAALAMAAWRTRDLLAESEAWQLVFLAAATPLVILAVIRVVYLALLSLIISLTEKTPRRRTFAGRWPVGIILATVFLLILPGLLSARRSDSSPPSQIPSAPGERVLVVGIDGVLPEELDYLLARGELPALSAMREAGGVLATYERSAEVPASFWTTVATGLRSPAHGVSSVDSFRPLGMTTALSRSGPLRSYWKRVEVPLRLAEHRPVLSNRRSAFAFWELAARGGVPVAAVNWWGTFPAQRLSGRLLAHGAFQLLTDGVPGAAEPESALPELEALRRRASADAGEEGAPGLPPAQRSDLLARALSPDRFYRQAFLQALTLSPKAAALYLPALDIAADGWEAGEVAFSDLLRSELEAADSVLAAALSESFPPDQVAQLDQPSRRGFDTVAVVVDPGRRRAAGEGRVLLWRREGCAATTGASIEPAALAAALIRALGLPQSAELPEPPAVCPWPAPPAHLATFGRRTRPRPPEGEGREYLENLRSLGYL